jgi:predicted Na+-dependent transporter
MIQTSRVSDTALRMLAMVLIICMTITLRLTLSAARATEMKGADSRTIGTTTWGHHVPGKVVYIRAQRVRCW